MAVAHDAVSESHTGTTGSVSEASFSWSHTVAGTPRGVLVFTFVGQSTLDDATAVTYGGVSMTAVTGGRAVDTVGEVGDCKAWFLGTSVPTGNQTVVVTRTNNTDFMYAVCVTVTAGGDTSTAGVVLLQENRALTEQSVNDGSPGANSVRYAGVNWGDSNPAPAGTNSTALVGIDFGVRVCDTVRETTAGQGARSVGFDSGATSDDCAAVHLAVTEIAASQPAGSLALMGVGK